MLVVAKAPIAGRVKTRLQARLSADAAAEVAEAALRDTFAAVLASRAARRIVALDGEAGPWLPDGFEVVAQGAGDLGARLTAAWSHVDGPCIQIGMDTPQVTAALLDDALDRLRSHHVDAVLGPAADGGWWALGLTEPVPGAFDGVPMSAPDTGACQLARLRALGLRVGMLPELTDVDRPDDLDRVAAEHPHLAVAEVARTLDGGATR